MAAGKTGKDGTQVGKACQQPGKHGVRTEKASRYMVEDRSTGSHPHEQPLGFRNLWREPVVRQWVEGDILFKESSERSVSFFELAFDLAFSGVIHILAEAAAVDRTGLGVCAATV